MAFPFFQRAWKSVRDHVPKWMQILGYAGRDFVIDDGLHWAAAIAFYGVLSIFPLVLAGVTVASWFTDTHGASQQASEMLRHVMPHADTVRDIIDKAIAARHHTGVFSIVLLLYTGGRAFTVLIRALNVACDMNETYGFFQRVLVEMAMLLSVGGLFLGALVANLLVPVLGGVLAPLPHGRAALVGLLGWTLPSLLLLGGFFCLYKFVPRQRCNWQSRSARVRCRHRSLRRREADFRRLHQPVGQLQPGLRLADDWHRPDDLGGNPGGHHALRRRGCLAHPDDGLRWSQRPGGQPPPSVALTRACSGGSGACRRSALSD